MRRLRPLTLAAALAAALPARAAPPPRCRVDNVSALAFGLYDPFAGAPLDAIGTVGYDCTSTPGPIIQLDAGSGTFAGRTLRQGGNVLVYQVYADAARTQVLGDGTAGTTTIDGTNSRKQTVALHGRVFASQLVARGAYADRLVVTIVF